MYSCRLKIIEDYMHEMQVFINLKEKKIVNNLKNSKII